MYKIKINNNKLLKNIIILKINKSLAMHRVVKFLVYIKNMSGEIIVSAKILYFVLYITKLT